MHTAVRTVLRVFVTAISGPMHSATVHTGITILAGKAGLAIAHVSVAQVRLAGAAVLARAGSAACAARDRRARLAVRTGEASLAHALMSIAQVRLADGAVLARVGSAACAANETPGNGIVCIDREEVGRDTVVSGGSSLDCSRRPRVHSGRSRGPGDRGPGQQQKDHDEYQGCTPKEWWRPEAVHVCADRHGVLE